MRNDKGEPSSKGARGEAVRRRVLDAAERLLRDGKAEFSMRDLAAEAEVSFATPFNQFGSKAAIMQALSSRRIDRMEAHYAAARPSGSAFDRVLLAVDIAVAVMLEEPVVNRAVMGWLGTYSATPGQVWNRSQSLWALALGSGDGLRAAERRQAMRDLPAQLAFGFRGALSFWTAGELDDEALGRGARGIATNLLRGFMEPQREPAP